MSPIGQWALRLDWLIVPAIIIGAAALLLHLNQGQISKHGDPLIDRMPWYGGLLIVLEAVLIGRHTPTPWVAAIVALIVVPALSFAQGILSAEWVMSIATGLLGAMVTIWAWRDIPWRPVAMLVIVAMVAAICWGIGFMHFAVRNKRFPTFVEKMRGRRQDAAAREFVAAFADRTGKRLEYEGLDTERIRGPEIEVGCVATTATEMLKKGDDLASMAHLNKEEAQLVRGRSEANIKIQFNLVDTLATMPVWRPRPGVDIQEPIPIGLTADGPAASIVLPNRHWFIGGMPGAGKTMLEQLIMASVVCAPNARLVFIDPWKRGDDVRDWQRLCWIWAVTRNDARSALQYLNRLADERYESGKKRGTSWTPTAEDPQIVVVVDEGSVLNRDGPSKEAMFDLASKNRGSGMTLVVATQFPQFEVFDINTKRLIEGRICMHTNDAASANMIIEGLGSKATALPMGGYCYVSSVDIPGGPVLARTWNLTQPILEDFLATHRALGYGPPLGNRTSGDALSGPREGLVSEAGPDRTDRPDVTKKEAVILKVLSDASEPLSQAEIVARGGGDVSKQTVSDRLPKLLERRLVAKAADDRWSLPVEVLVP